MKSTGLRAASAICLLLPAAPALAGERWAILSVENVDCVTCAPIVKRTLSRMPGVSQVVVAERGDTADVEVRFDDGRVTPEALTTAVSNAGFPARVKRD